MATVISSGCRSLVSNVFFTYYTVKQIKVHSTYVGFIYRILQCIVLAYIVVYIVWIKKGYQDVETPRGASIIKVKGVARVFNSNSTTNAAQPILWDAAEYLVPPLEESAFFIITRKIVTYNQTPGACPSPLTKKLNCNTTYNPCAQGMASPDTFGFMTGNCVRSHRHPKANVCEIYAWCPQELSNSTDYRINTDDLQNFTVFIKTVVIFPNYNIKIRTVKDNTNFSCRFHSDTNPHCPIFSVGYILRKLYQQDNNTDLMALYHRGGLIEITQNWKCDFDFAVQQKECFPIFTFNLLQRGIGEPSPGINYRFTEKYVVNGLEYRTLTKVYGLRFVLSIRGKGRRFDIVRLFVAVGSGVGYMMVATFVCELIFSKCHKYNKEYSRNKVKVCHLSQINKDKPIELTTISNAQLIQPLTSSEITDQSITR